jgi:hypothetical protein
VSERDRAGDREPESVPGLPPAVRAALKWRDQIRDLGLVDGRTSILDPKIGCGLCGPNVDRYRSLRVVVSHGVVHEIANQSLQQGSITYDVRGVQLEVDPNTGAITAFAIASYFINYLASLVEAIEPLRSASVFYHYHGTEVLTGGIQWSGLVLLLALYAVLVALSVFAFRRREIGGGQGIALPWTRRRPAEVQS